MSADHRLLLKEAALLYEKHEARRPRPSFNVFSVLRTESDEVNLHSRFLHALLDYRKPAEENRENLTDFLRHVGVGDFEQRGIRVEREPGNIDILITNDAGQAVVIENKIWAGDRPEQLLRYHTTLTEQGYGRIHLLYLTPYGHDPSEDSAGNLSYKTISYRDKLPPWLERCQQRAYDEPELRESVAQYRQLIRRLTGTDFGEVYMNELMALCLEGSNLARLHDLHEVLDNKVRPHLVEKLLRDVDVALQEEIPDLSDKDDSEGDLYYPFGNGAFLGVATFYTYLGFGVSCEKSEHLESYNTLLKALGNVNGGRSTDNWPWWYYPHSLRVKNTTPKDLVQLTEPNRKEHAKGIARALKPVWEAAKRALASQNP